MNRKDLSRIVVIASALVALSFLTLQGSTSAASRQPTNSTNFADYWYQGKAELTRYSLEQARYGELHKGHAVLIFVTEDFLPEKQVKADDPNRSRSGAWPVLKLNATKKFSTGLYPYSMMTSVFTPLDVTRHPRSLKATTSVQEWCGHTFLQINKSKDHYRARGFSYFESEGDSDAELPLTWLEDEIWTRLRIDPDSVPTGKVRMIPGGQQHRLRHRRLEALEATATRSEEGDGVMAYAIRYAQDNRELTILYQKAFPHQVEGWRETYSSGGRRLTTVAKRTHSMQTDYWTKNSNRHNGMREDLGI